MKKTLKIIVATILLITAACTDEDKFNNPAHFELENGSFIRFENNQPEITYVDAQNIVFSDIIYDANNNTQNYSLALTATVGGVEFEEVPFFSTSTFPTTLNITSQNIADALDIDVETINFGDSFNFSATAIRTDGEVFDITNTEENLLNEIAYKDAMTFSFIISCPFHQDEIIGEYEVINDSWGDYYTGDIISIVAGEESNTYKILTTTNMYLSNAAENVYIEVTVDSETGLSTAESNTDYIYTLSFFNATVSVSAETGLTLSCKGNISLELEFSDSGGSYGVYNFTLQKIQ